VALAIRQTDFRLLVRRISNASSEMPKKTRAAGLRSNAGVEIRRCSFSCVYRRRRSQFAGQREITARNFFLLCGSPARANTVCRTGGGTALTQSLPLDSFV
jgi:hypothetical protein